MLRAIIPPANVRMTATARSDRGSAAAARFEYFLGAVETIHSSARALRDSPGERVPAIQKSYGIDADMI